MIRKSKGINFAQIGSKAKATARPQPSIGAAVRTGGLVLTPGVSVTGIKPLRTLN